MENNSDNKQLTAEKSYKSKFWIVSNIWLIIITSLVILGIIWRIISWLLFSYLGIGENFIEILNLLVIIGILFYSVRSGIKLVLNKSIVLREDIIKISFGVTIPIIIFQIVVVAFYSSKLPTWGLTHVCNLIAIDASLFFITYYWLKKLIPKTQNQ